LRYPLSFPTRRSSDLLGPHIYPGFGSSRDVPVAIIDHYFPGTQSIQGGQNWAFALDDVSRILRDKVAESVILSPLNVPREPAWRSEEHTSELQSRFDL